MSSETSKEPNPVKPWRIRLNPRSGVQCGYEEKQIWLAKKTFGRIWKKKGRKVGEGQYGHSKCRMDYQDLSRM